MTICILWVIICQNLPHFQQPQKLGSIRSNHFCHIQSNASTFIPSSRQWSQQCHLPEALNSIHCRHPLTSSYRKGKPYIIFPPGYFLLPEIALFELIPGPFLPPSTYYLPRLRSRNFGYEYDSSPIFWYRLFACPAVVRHTPGYVFPDSRDHDR